MNTDELFDLFWSAGMRKMNKKKAKHKFILLVKAHSDPVRFTYMLVKDIELRIKNNQQGFDMMHPTTYLNGERWEDEHRRDCKTTRKQTTSERVSGQPPVGQNDGSFR
jgi:hypothetical protein